MVSSLPRTTITTVDTKFCWETNFRMENQNISSHFKNINGMKSIMKSLSAIAKSDCGGIGVPWDCLKYFTYSMALKYKHKH